MKNEMFKLWAFPVMLAILGLMFAIWLTRATHERCKDLPAYNKPAYEMSEADKQELALEFCH